MVRKFFLCALAASAGCSFGDDRSMQNGDGGPDGMADGPSKDKDHLLLSEIKATTNTTEFIEIWNPTSREISLKNYYVSDVGDYWRLPSNPTRPISSDFVARFPDGAVIRSKQVITIAMDAALFSAAYGIEATYALDITTGAQAMAEVITQSNTAGEPSITDDGEPVVLFYWDRTSDLVQDVDIVIASGTTTLGTNSLLQKQPVDGPDANSDATPYKADAGFTAAMNGLTAPAPAPVTSYKRRTLETGSESQLGTGNGITGDDETSEALKSTWDGDGATPFTAPTPGSVPAI